MHLCCCRYVMHRLVAPCLLTPKVTWTRCKHSSGCPAPLCFTMKKKSQSPPVGVVVIVALVVVVVVVVAPCPAVPRPRATAAVGCVQRLVVAVPTPPLRPSLDHPVSGLAATTTVAVQPLRVAVSTATPPLCPPPHRPVRSVAVAVAVAAGAFVVVVVVVTPRSANHGRGLPQRVSGGKTSK